MPKKQYNLKPTQTKAIAEDTAAILLNLIPHFKNSSAQDALRKCYRFLKSEPREGDLASALPGYSEIMRARKAVTFYCVMAPATTILHHYYWLYFNQDHEEAVYRFAKMKRTHAYLECINECAFEALTIQGNIREGFRFKTPPQTNRL